MSFDIRRATREEIQAINDRARAWKARQAKQSGEVQDAAPSVSESQEAQGQLTLKLDVA